MRCRYWTVELFRWSTENKLTYIFLFRYEIKPRRIALVTIKKMVSEMLFINQICFRQDHGGRQPVHTHNHVNTTKLFSSNQT